MLLRRISIIICLGLLLCLAGCDNDNGASPDRVTGSGKLVTAVRTVPHFSSVAMTAAGDIEITSGETQSVSVRIDDNLLQYLKTEVSDGELRIEIDNSINPQDYDLTVEITMTDLQSLTLTGAGTIVGKSMFVGDSVSVTMTGVGTIVLNVECDKLVTILTGVGTVSLSGSAGELDVTNSGVGNLAAFGLESDRAKIVTTGIGDCEVYVNDDLDVTITGTGSVYYKGSPSIYAAITGIGMLVDAN